MLQTLHSDPVWLYLWSSLSIFVTPWDFILLSLSIENTIFHVWGYSLVEISNLTQTEKSEYFLMELWV